VRCLQRPQSLLILHPHGAIHVRAALEHAEHQAHPRFSPANWPWKKYASPACSSHLSLARTATPQWPYFDDPLPGHTLAIAASRCGLRTSGCCTPANATSSTPVAGESGMPLVLGMFQRRADMDRAMRMQNQERLRTLKASTVCSDDLQQPRSRRLRALPLRCLTGRANIPEAARPSYPAS